MYFTTYNSPLGDIEIFSDNDNLTGLFIKNQKYYDEFIKNIELKNANLRVFDIAKNWLDEYFMGHNPDPKTLPLLPKGSDFRMKIWQLVSQIPYGKTATYSQIATKFSELENRAMSNRAVGAAIGHNPLLIMIPCHRVVGANKNLTGYAGGIENKIKLLKLEGVDIDKFKV